MFETIKVAMLSSVLIAGTGSAVQGAAPPRFFPYSYTTDDLTNGLRLVTVPTDNPNLVALYIVVQTGSRNEVEPGKSGYAHFFEHMMVEGRNAFLDRHEILRALRGDTHDEIQDCLFRCAVVPGRQRIGLGGCTRYLRYDRRGEKQEPGNGSQTQHRRTPSFQFLLCGNVFLFATQHLVATQDRPRDLFGSRIRAE